MEALLVGRPETAKGRARRLAFALGACATAFGFATPTFAQSIDSGPTRAPAHHDSPRRARTMRPERTPWGNEPKRDYAENVEGASLLEGSTDVALLETRIRDLSAKVRELSELLQRQRDTAAPVHFVLQPMRITLLERDRPARVPTTYGEALEVVVRERVRGISASFHDGEERARLAIDPEPAEVRRLLDPIYERLPSAETPARTTQAHLEALIYATLLEARAKIATPEPLPAVYRMLRDLHVDREGLTEHLRRSFLIDHPALGRDLGAVLAAVATVYPDPPSMRDFLQWVAASVSTDLQDELLWKAVYPYRGDTEGQFDAAAENATNDNGDVLKLQVELQRLLVEAKGLRGTHRVGESTAGDWQHRLLQAERDLDHLLRAADSEREAVMTLVRRVPFRQAVAVAAPVIETLAVEPAEEVASDDLTTQH